jgi:hypothetical protein
MEVIQMKQLSDLCWHDGILNSVCIVPTRQGTKFGNFTFDVSLYPLNIEKDNPDWGKPRADKIFIFEGVTFLEIKLDFVKLSLNANFGNIDRVIISKSQPTNLKLDLMGGTIEVDYKKVKLLSK